jgi:hypothetical protein
MVGWIGRDHRTDKTSRQKQRKAILEKTFGIDRDKIKPFSEEDRGEDRD